MSDTSGGWDAYWGSKQSKGRAVYDVVATWYRNTFIRAGLNRTIGKHFAPSSRLLHGGCGSGHVDTSLQSEMRITPFDLSFPALQIYSSSNPENRRMTRGSVFELPFHDGSFDGAYNLGVIEHFDENEIASMLREFRRTIRPGGKVVIFWPHTNGSSVNVLRVVHWTLHRLLRKNIQLHPPEISLVRSREHARRTLDRAGFELVEYSFGPRDGFVQAAVVGRKRE